MAAKLNAGERIPRIELTTTDGDKTILPDDLSAPYTIALFYRGHW